MKKFALALFFAGITAVTFAQGAASSKANTIQTADEKAIEERAKEITASMASHLRLTTEQTQRLYEINLRSMVSAEEAKEKYKSDPRKIVKQMDVINNTRLSQIKDILTPLQFQQYQQRREEKMGVPKEAQSNPARRNQGPMNQQSY